MLYDECGVIFEKIWNVKFVVYMIIWKDGSKKEVDFKKDSYIVNLFDLNLIK